MSRNRKPRKAHRPREVMNPLAFIRPASAADRHRITDRFASALEAMVRCSSPTAEEWRDLSDAINTVETMLLEGVLADEEVRPLVVASIRAMAEAGTRHRAGHALRLSGDGVQAVREVIQVYAAAMEVLTEARMYQLQRLTERRVQAALAGRALEGVEVVTC